MRHQGTARHVVTPRTLVFCERGGQWLFLEGAAGKWFAGRLNGLGGSVERGEDVASAAAREVEEECGLAPSGLRLGAVVHVDADPQVMLFVFTATLADGAVRASAEGRLVWHPLAALHDASVPFLDDVRSLLPRLLARGGAAVGDAKPGATGDAPLSLTARW